MVIRWHFFAFGVVLFWEREKEGGEKAKRTWLGSLIWPDPSLEDPPTLLPKSLNVSITCQKTSLSSPCFFWRFFSPLVGLAFVIQKVILHALAQPLRLQILGWRRSLMWRLIRNWSSALLCSGDREFGGREKRKGEERVHFSRIRKDKVLAMPFSFLPKQPR